MSQISSSIECSSWSDFNSFAQFVLFWCNLRKVVLPEGLKTKKNQHAGNLQMLGSYRLYSGLNVTCKFHAENIPNALKQVPDLC